MISNSLSFKTFLISAFCFFNLDSFGQNNPVKIEIKKAENQWLYASSLDSVNSVHYFAKLFQYEDESYIEYKKNGESILLNITWASSDSSLVIYAENNGDSINFTYEKISFPDSLFYDSGYYNIDGEFRLFGRSVIPQKDFLFYGKLTSNSNKNLLPQFLLFADRYKPRAVVKAYK
ncbi:MAG: hypothetical protein AB8B53_04305 [Flavobacteriales bacterium]